MKDEKDNSTIDFIAAKQTDSIPASAQAAIAPQGHVCIAAAGSAQREPGERPAASPALPPRPDWLKPVSMPQPKKQARRPKSFNVMRSVMDVESFVAPKPEGARLVIAPGIDGGHFVSVSFVAKDWSVTPRRIRALLCDGRLLGRLQDNGYWEVRFPYSFIFGTRGPGLKRQQKQERRTV